MREVEPLDVSAAEILHEDLRAGGRRIELRRIAGGEVECAFTLSVSLPSGVPIFATLSFAFEMVVPPTHTAPWAGQPDGFTTSTERALDCWLASYARAVTVTPPFPGATKLNGCSLSGIVT